MTAGLCIILFTVAGVAALASLTHSATHLWETYHGTC